MAIYKYTLVKYLKSWSTWIIAGVTFSLIFFLAGFVAFHNFKPNSNNAARNYAVLVVSLVSGITSFLAIFTSVFSGFKSASMFKDEVEDGTFLVMLSKPITRSKLILFKWLALLTMLIGYTLLVSLSFLLTVVVFDNGYKVKNLNLGGINLSTLRSSVIMVSVIMWGILTVVSLIFSSIALLLSTKLSVGTTIGISIALGVIIPITSLISVFTKKPEYKSLNSNNASMMSEVLKNFNLEDEDITKDVKTLYSLGFATGESDSYKTAFIGDLNFQIGVLSSFSSDRAIPEQARDFASQTFAGNVGTPGLSSGRYELAKNQGFFVDVKSGDKFTQLKNQFLNSTWYTWEKTWSLRTKLLLASAAAMSIIKPNDKVPLNFINPKNYTNFFDDKDWEKIKNAKTSADQWKEMIQFGLQESQKLQVDSATATVDQIKHQINMQTMFSKVASYVDGHVYNFSIDKNKIALLEKTPIVKKYINTVFKNLSSGGITISNALLPMYYVSWLSDPTGVLSTETINTLFNEKKLKEDGDKKYIPLSTKGTDIVDHKTAANYILSDSGGIKAKYIKVMMLLDNGNLLKKINYVEYASRNWLLFIYIAIALGLVPLTYLMIRKQDYR